MTTVLCLRLRRARQVDSVLVVRRKDNGKLACVGGFVEVGETLEEATRREVMEETGLDVTSLRMLPRVRTKEHSSSSSSSVLGCCYFHVPQAPESLFEFRLEEGFSVRFVHLLQAVPVRNNVSISAGLILAPTR